MTLDALLDAQRAAQWAEARAARDRDAEVVAVHPAGHLGPCPRSSGGTITRGEIERLGSGAVWHLDSDQAPPDWWPTTGYVVPPPTPAEVARARAERIDELWEAEEADRARTRALHGIAPG